MLHKIWECFFPKGKFRLVNRKPISDCTIRPITEEDFEQCEEIYKLNEPRHFPPGYFPQFSVWLRERHSFVVVIEQEHTIRAFGGINVDPHQDRQDASLTFGMAHPDYQKTGLGTTLLLSRLALLRRHSHPTFVCLSTVGGSESFYGRFGFRYIGAQQASPDYLQKTYYVRVSAEDASRCYAELKSLPFPLGFFEYDIPSASKLQTSEVRVNA